MSQLSNRYRLNLAGPPSGGACMAVLRTSISSIHTKFSIHTAEYGHGMHQVGRPRKAPRAMQVTYRAVRKVVRKF